jgi:hypothetical protein
MAIPYRPTSSIRKERRLKIYSLFYFQTVRDRKILEVHVDKGMVDGQKITFGGEGDQEPGLEPGDIIIVLDEKEHDVYK